MLWGGAPVNISVATGNTDAAPDLTGLPNNGPVLFSNGADLYAALLDPVSSSPLIVKSSDAGTTWAVMDGGYSLPTTVTLIVDGTGTTIFLLCQDSADFIVVQFDMATDAYTSTSSTLTLNTGSAPDFSGSAGGACLANGDFYLIAGYSDPNPLLGSLGYNVLSSGVWSGVTVVDSTPVALNRNCSLTLDSAGDLHFFYQHLTSTSGSTFPTELRHVAPGGSPSTIQTVLAPLTTSYDIAGSIAWNGKLYLANRQDENVQYVYVSDSDTAPTSWTNVLLDSGVSPFSNIGLGRFWPDVANNLLYLFYMNGNFDTTSLSLYYVVMDATETWSAPVLAYDVATNPASDLGEPVTSVIFRSLGVTRIGSKFYGMTNFLAAAQNAYLLRANLRRARSFVF